LALAPTLLGYGMAFVGNLLSAAIRLSVIGQTDGQRLTASLLPMLQDAAIQAESSTLDDIASATFAADLASMQHETQYTRLFRS
jgi:urease accessory protein